MRALGGKVAVVTGGGSGIGLAMATRFRAAGMRVVLGDIEQGALDAAVAGLGDDALGVRCDVTSPSDNEALREAAIDRFGAVHVVCLNAGVAPSGPLLDTGIETWRWLLEVNVLGVVHGMRTFGPGLVEQGEGHIVCTASAAGLSSTPSLGAYAASKHAVVGLAATLRDELAPSGVGVSVLCPGVIRTRIFESERNRPADVTGETHTDPGAVDLFRKVLDAAPGPEAVADAVHDAVLDDRLFVLPSPEVNGLIAQRLDAVRSAMPS
jgi:NAD(P)-dependent dehydrogenase (short-subunit alcohol dehydrogenase family)